LPTAIEAHLRAVADRVVGFNHDLAKDQSPSGTGWPVIDINGNTIGRYGLIFD
jgi:hypothetical protein